MDRLKAKAYEHEYMGVANLHSNMDRLKVYDTDRDVEKATYLHSNMDRLKVSLHSKQRVQFSKFTFQYG